MNKATKLTIQNIAKKAQVSQSTVSRVLSGNAPVTAAKREAVLAAVAAIEMGHRHIAHVSAPMYYHGPINDIYQRYQGYVQALTEAGIELDEQLVVEGDLSRQSGLLALQKLVGGKRPFTAIFAANDQMAVGVRLGLHRRGLRVPEDVSLVGFDDEPTSAHHYASTSH